MVDEDGTIDARITGESEATNGAEFALARRDEEFHSAFGGFLNLDSETLRSGCDTYASYADTCQLSKGQRPSEPLDFGLPLATDEQACEQHKLSSCDGLLAPSQDPHFPTGLSQKISGIFG